MSDRHQELLHQRALVQEHLLWLNREIALASDSHSRPAPARRPLSPAPAPTAPVFLAGQADTKARHAATPAPASLPIASTENPAVGAAADAILSEYRVAPDTLKTDIRKGCLLYFVGALALVAVGLTGLYFLISKR